MGKNTSQPSCFFWESFVQCPLFLVLDSNPWSIPSCKWILWKALDKLITSTNHLPINGVCCCYIQGVVYTFKLAKDLAACLPNFLWEVFEYLWCERTLQLHKELPSYTLISRQPSDCSWLVRNGMSSYVMTKLIVQTTKGGWVKNLSMQFCAQA